MKKLKACTFLIEISTARNKNLFGGLPESITISSWERPFSAKRCVSWSTSSVPCGRFSTASEAFEIVPSLLPAGTAQVREYPNGDVCVNQGAINYNQLNVTAISYAVYRESGGFQIKNIPDICYP